MKLKAIAFTMAASVFLTVSSALAYPDELKEVASCTQLENFDLVSYGATLSEGGIAGITQLTVTKYYRGEVEKVTNFLVKRSDPRYSPVGSPVTYKTRSASLAIKATTKPLEDGGHYSTLTLKSKQNGKTVLNTYELSCILK